LVNVRWMRASQAAHVIPVTGMTTFWARVAITRR
jgi:hypothetical protein